MKAVLEHARSVGGPRLAEMTFAQRGALLATASKIINGARDELIEIAVKNGRTPRFVSQHVLVPRQGAAVHVNAFNFPGWGFAEKAACAWLAGVPVVTKP